VPLAFVKPERLLLINHPEYREKWVQERIAEDPSILSLGVVDCQRTPANEIGARDFRPLVFHVLDGSGSEDEAHLTNIDDFRARYVAWLRRPADGAQPFALPADEWKLKYATAVSQRELDAVQYVPDMLEKKVRWKHP
jgi:hypothetical protein